jgi:hypothetical protein
MRSGTDHRRRPRRRRWRTRVGAQVFVDAVHYAPHELVDVRAIDCDFLGCSAYKFYGPHIGVLYGKHELLAEIDFPKLLPSPNTAPERAETGTQNHEGMAGAAAAVEFLASLAPGESRRDRLRAAFRSAARTRHRAGDTALEWVVGDRRRLHVWRAAVGAAHADCGVHRPRLFVHGDRAAARGARGLRVER